MNKILKNSLRIPFMLDAIIAIGFGICSLFFPHETFGTILLIPEQGESAFLSMLSTISVFYILIGLTCLIGFKSKSPIHIWIGFLMIIRHGSEGTIKIFDMGKEWLIGNPYPDLIIHSVFIFVYMLAIYVTYRNEQISYNS